MTTVGQYDHVAAAAYLLKHAGTTALMVVNAQTGQPADIITEADGARAIADGTDVGNVRVSAVMTTRPALITTTSIRDAAKIMTARRISVTCPSPTMPASPEWLTSPTCAGADQRRRRMTGTGRRSGPSGTGHAFALTTAVLPQSGSNRPHPNDRKAQISQFGTQLRP